MLSAWVARTPWVDFLAADPAIRSNTSVCLKVVDPTVVALAANARAAFAKDLAAAVEKEGAGYDHCPLSRRAARTAYLVRSDGRGTTTSKR